jgi:hypothetical protein
MRDIYRTLRRQPNTRPILHTAWRQPAGAKKRMRATHLYGGTDFSENYDFQGNPIIKDDVIVICNMTPVPREAYRIGVPEKGIYRIIFNSDDSRYCGSGFAVKKRYTSEEIKWQSRDQSITISLPPLGMIALKRVNSKEKS